MSKRSAAIKDLLPFAQAIVELEPDLVRLDKIDQAESDLARKLERQKRADADWEESCNTRRQQFEVQLQEAKRKVDEAKKKAATTDADAADILAEAHKKAENIIDEGRSKRVAEDTEHNTAIKRAREGAQADLEAVQREVAEARTQLGAVKRDIAKHQGVLDELKQRLAPVLDK